MVNEKEEGYEGQEESEYHFSDDQSTYEMEPEVESEAAKAPAVSAKSNMLDNVWA